VLLQANAQFTAGVGSNLSVITAYAYITGSTSATWMVGYKYTNSQIAGTATVTNAAAFYAANTGYAGITNAYGVYIEAQSGASNTNIGLYNLGTSRFEGTMGFATAPVSNAGLWMATGFNVPTVGGAAYGVLIQPTMTAASGPPSLYALYVSASWSSSYASAICYDIQIIPTASPASASQNIALNIGGSPSGATTNLVISHSSGAQLTTAGAWANAPSWRSTKTDILAVERQSLEDWFDWLTTNHKPVRYRHPLVQNDDGLVTQAYTQDGDYDHFGFLLDDVPQDIREVWCVNETGGLSTKDTEGFLLAMLKVSGQRIKSLEARLTALEAA
jgi:hypothetical protein